MRLLCAILLLAARASAQEAIPAKPSPADYKAAAKAGSLTLAASFEGHTVPAPDASFVIQHYIVIELALYPGKNKEIEFDSGQFTLRLNGKKQTLFAQTPGMVAASLQYGSFENTRRLEASGGVGNAGVILGRDTAGRFPGDRRPPAAPPGMPPKVPDANPTIEKEPALSPAEWVNRLAWSDGRVKGPAAGLLYFSYQGGLGKLKSVELVFAGSEGPATLLLR